MMSLRAWAISGVLAAILPVYSAGAAGAAGPGEPEAKREGGAKAPAQDSMALSYTAIPYLFFGPETRWGGGGAGGVFKRLHGDARPSSLLLMAQYTQLHQYQVGVRADHYTAGNRASAWMDATFREFPDRFFGVGEDTPDSLEEAYTARSVTLAGQGMLALSGGLKAGVLAIVRMQTMVETEAGRSLDRGEAPGSGSWTLAGLGPQIAWDTRDAVFFPRSGSWVELGHAFYPEWRGNGFTFHQLRLNARRYQGLGHGQVLAFQGGFDLLWGEVPFPALAQLGGASLLRGYYLGRHRDKALALAQAEYRFPVWRRLGGAAFAAGGKVAGDPIGLAESRLRAAGGAGLRYRVNREGVNLRVDMAVNREAESSLYVTFMEAF